MTKAMPELLDGTRLQEYLRDRVKKTVTGHSLQLSEITEFYIVNLLMNFERSEKLFTLKDEQLSIEPLAMMLAHAINGDSAIQVRELKRLGDTALYFSGMFAEHIKKGPVGINYYVDMGSSAYSSLASQMVGEKLFKELYLELAEKFPDLTSVLAELAIADAAVSNTHLLSLYERWLATGNEDIRKKLVLEGIIPQNKKISC